jgi:hypothetical protein
MNNKLLFIQTCRRLLPLLHSLQAGLPRFVFRALPLSHARVVAKAFSAFSFGFFFARNLSGASRIALRHSATFEPGIVAYCGVFCLCWGSVGFAASARGRLPMSSKTFWLSNQNSLPEYLSSQSRFRKLHKSILGNFSSSFSLLFSVLVRYWQCLLLSFQ